MSPTRESVHVANKAWALFDDDDVDADVYLTMSECKDDIRMISFSSPSKQPGVVYPGKLSDTSSLPLHLCQNLMAIPAIRLGSMKISIGHANLEKEVPADQFCVGNGNMRNWKATGRVRAMAK
ncbi:unnamed protein product [Haemonchus placei]|uniref:PITH domain-containing protein n=1 Tax=Haemonchus placei TaxID=6290 RepID=A0A0N4WXZ7_HAEPC|nr:unnamed protein product [Haemonchus placei]